MNDPIKFPELKIEKKKASATIVYNDSLGQTMTIRGEHVDGVNTLAVNFAPPLRNDRGVADPLGLIEGLSKMLDWLKEGAR